MEALIKAFEIYGTKNEYIKLEINEIYGFPNETSFRGGYDIKCNLSVSSDIYSITTDDYYSSTGALYNFYNQLKKCYDTLNGKASYEVYFAENYLLFDVLFKDGKASISGQYRHNPMLKNILYFEFESDQSYFAEVMNDLEQLIKRFGDNKGINNIKNTST